MNNLKILSIFGTRPEAIKMAPVIRELEKYPELLTSSVCLTGQHREMIEPMLELFDIRPDYDLGIMKPGQTLSGLTGELFLRLEPVIRELRPDWILAQGDTTTVMAAGMMAYYHGVAFGHIEAGLRTGDLGRPFPEECNRRIADLVATLYFAPTERAQKNLLAEGVAPEKIHLTGNTVIDSLLWSADREPDWEHVKWKNRLNGERLILVTAHRRESFGAPFERICRAIRILAENHRDYQFIYPVHLNPEVQRQAHQHLSGLENVILTDPVDYLELVYLMRQAHLVLTDSGGIQEEALTFPVPVLVLREKTERPEGVEAGRMLVVGTEEERIVAGVEKLLHEPEAYSAMTLGRNPYGDGKAAERIVRHLLETQKDN
jgi:UDP-N-acetylglucosamine 2-epimerase (non-hydrolysing)